MLIKTLVLSPVIVPQALWVVRRALRLPEAAGARTGTLGHGPSLRLLVVGDSSAAGVGVETQSQALAARLAGELSRDATVSWRVAAKSGATVATTLERVRKLPCEPVDLALIALGVNDAKNGVRLRAWDRGYQQLLGMISDRFGPKAICVSGLPPVRHFPILPRPLADVIGDRAEVFDRTLRRIVEGRADTHYLPLIFDPDRFNMAPDGFHPGPEVYAEWARRAAALFAEVGLRQGVAQ